jgi:hypothetical protein
MMTKHYFITDIVWRQSDFDAHGDLLGRETISDVSAALAGDQLRETLAKCLYDECGYEPVNFDYREASDADLQARIEYMLDRNVPANERFPAPKLV